MLLSDRDLAFEISEGRLALDPFEPELIQPASIDVRLDKYFRVFNSYAYGYIDPSEEQPHMTELREVPEGEPFVLVPGEFVLASTLEEVKMGGKFAGQIEGKSSLGRLGLLVHSTAGFIDPGFEGHITLELSNINGLPIWLWPGMRIAQLGVFRLRTGARHLYGSKVYGSRYQGQRGPTASRAWQNWKVWPTRSGEVPAVVPSEV